MALRQVCTFRVESMSLGLDVEHVQEVLRHQEMTEVPLAPPAVRGLINLRGQIVTAVDLRTRLGLALRPEGVEPMNVVVRTEDGAISLWVDEIGDVIEAADDSFERTPETLPAMAKELIRGVYKLPDRLMLVLDRACATNLDSVGAA